MKKFVVKNIDKQNSFVYNKDTWKVVKYCSSFAEAVKLCEDLNRQECPDLKNFVILGDH